MDKKRILIVDDEEDLAMAMRIRLEKAGYDILIANDGKSGLDLARKERPDLMLLDLMLPKIDGYKVCRMLKFDENYKNIPIIILTAKAQNSDKDLGFEVGADDYLVKPFESEILLEKIKTFIGEE